MTSGSNDDYLERVKAEIRADADTARKRHPLPRHDCPPQPRPHAAPSTDGIERERMDYAIGELTGTHYRAFVETAFRALLKRAPDEAGATAQIHVLASGASKAEVLGNLRWSPEGRRVGVIVRGLLPRYALAKCARIPLLGYLVQWFIVLAGLPVLIRHQRASDTSVAADFAAAADSRGQHERRTQQLGERILDLDQRLNSMADDIRQTLLRLDNLARRTTAIANAQVDSAQEVADLRHGVHTTNHWVVSLQQGLAEIDEAALALRTRADQLAVAVHDAAATSVPLDSRYKAWADELAIRLPASSIVLDLGSGEGTWLDALGACGLAARGVEANAVLVARAQARGARVALGDPQGTLARCPDAGLGGVVVTTEVLGTSDMRITELLLDAQRALQPGGCLLLRLEPDMSSLVRSSALTFDAEHWTLVARGAGFSDVVELAAGNATALFARRA